MKRTVAVIGGGLGGMTAAGELAKAGCAVTLFERGACLGGKAAVVED
ncbi:MAG: NAD(P)-binding Rossmann-like domain, partial [Myxococcaceae bacterium]|nr:NAD(P)-binding Rossmann-like domain [Myxococcaceae bacterium]